jgi:hypothetical protein
MGPMARLDNPHEERNGILLRSILVLQCDAARMALGDASWYAAPVDHHSGSTGGKISCIELDGADGGRSSRLCRW